MARIVDGTSSFLRLARAICRIAGKYGTVRFGQRTTPQFAAAVAALVVACQAFDAIDDYPGEIDNSAPFGPEDDSKPS